MPSPPRPLPLGWLLARDRFMEKVGPYTESGCRDWLGSLLRSGYGQLRVGDRSVRAHRLAWALEHGIDPGALVVLHTCDRPSSVEPSHLRVGTQGDNMADRAAKGRHPQSAKTHCPAGHEYTESNLYRYEGRRYCRTCSLLRGTKKPPRPGV